MPADTSYIAVFCGSRAGNLPIYEEHAAALGALIGQEAFSLVYGGASVGIMGTLANHAMTHGAKVVGVIPKLLLQRERYHSGLTELIVTEDMHERKKMMYEMCNAAVILPGGFGTLDELFEMLTWNQLSIHDKKIYILNSGGFYDHLIRHLQSLQEHAFLYDSLWTRLASFDEPIALMKEIKLEAGS